jgi:endogenous inhibitor of DNA gyrase (YacG/DUF329 family)
MAPNSGIKQLPCCICGQSVPVGEEAESATCGRHFASRYADPPIKGEPVARKNHGLGAFISENCADHVAGRCIVRGDGACVALAGRRSGRFERCLLPLARQKGGDVVAVIEKHYAIGQQVPGLRQLAGDEEQRPCPDCGTPLGYRQRYCPDCSVKRQRQAARDAVRRKRLNGRQAVST